MKRLRKFASLSPSERGLLLRTAILLSAVRLALWLLPFRRIASVTERNRSRAGKTVTRPDQVAWAVRAVSRYVPKPTCLVQALTAKVLLENAGFSARLHIGVAKGAAKPFEAHAWVEARGMVITGAGELERYSPLLLWES